VTELPDRAVDRLTEIIRSDAGQEPRYQLGDLIAQGGMGSVYRARDRVLDRDVAIKVVRGDDARTASADRLVLEAMLLGRLDHPGLVPVHDLGRLPDGRPYYAMRLVRGENLERHLESVRDLSQRLRTFLKICEPVAFAHAQNAIHRDLKPANIMVGPFGEVLVLDWGIAKVPGVDPVERTTAFAGPGTTDPGTVLGTVGFMAPEQAAGGSRDVDPRADVYSLGAILAQMLATADRPPPRALAAIRDRAMALVPAARYQTVSELAADVERFLDGQAVRAYRERWLERAGRFVARNQGAVALIGAYLLVRLALLLW
jgi:serine/threonine protein kinase